MAKIRKATAADRDDVVRLWMDLLRSQAAIDERYSPAEDAEIRWRNDYNEWLNRPSRRLFVADDGGGIHGFVTAERWTSLPVYRVSSEIYVGELYVEPRYRRSGVGRSLLQAVRGWAAEVGADGIRAGMLASNEEAAAFWGAAGGEAIAVTIGIDLKAGKDAEDAPSESRVKLGF